MATSVHSISVSLPTQERASSVAGQSGSNSIRVTSKSDHIVQPRPPALLSSSNPKAVSSVKWGRFEVFPERLIPTSDWAALGKAPPAYLHTMHSNAALLLAGSERERSRGEAHQGGHRTGGHGSGGKASGRRLRRVAAPVDDSLPADSYPSSSGHASSQHSIVASTGLHAGSEAGDRLQTQPLAPPSSLPSHQPALSSIGSVVAHSSVPTVLMTSLPAASSTLSLAASAFAASTQSAATTTTTSTATASTTAGSTAPPPPTTASQAAPTITPESLLSAMAAEQAAQCIKMYTSAFAAINHLKNTVTTFGKVVGIQPVAAPATVPASASSSQLASSGGGTTINASVGTGEREGVVRTASSDTPTSNMAGVGSFSTSAAAPSSLAEELEKLRAENKTLRISSHKLATELKSLKSVMAEQVGATTAKMDTPSSSS